MATKQSKGRDPDVYEIFGLAMTTTEITSLFQLKSRSTFTQRVQWGIPPEEAIGVKAKKPANNSIGSPRREFEYEECLAYARKVCPRLGIDSMRKWRAAVAKGDLDRRAPAFPYHKYRDCGWISASEFLGDMCSVWDRRTGFSYRECCQYVASLGITSNKQWRALWKNGQLDPRAPCIPSTAYHDEWKGWREFFGKPPPSTASPVSYGECHRYATKLAKGNPRFGARQWAATAHPPGIPRNPDRVYHEWEGWTVFFGR